MCTYISQVLLMTVSFLVVHEPTARKRNRFNKQNNSKNHKSEHPMLAPAARHNNMIIAKRPIEERYKIVAK